jgi:hypothetical protein
MSYAGLIRVSILLQDCVSFDDRRVNDAGIPIEDENRELFKDD